MRQPRSFRRPRRGNYEDEGILPLINVVFLLLIFFMVVGRLSASDPFEISPPKSLSEGIPAAEDLLISVGTEGALALNGAVVDEASLIATIAETDPFEVRIKSDSAVQATRLIALMERLRAIGVQEVRLMTVPRLEDVF